MFTRGKQKNWSHYWKDMNVTDILSTTTSDVGQSDCDHTAAYLAIVGGVIALLSEGMGACSHENCPNGFVDAVRQGLRSPCVAQLFRRHADPRATVQDSDLPL